MGGAGPPVAEQPAREGAIRFALVGHDGFAPSSMARMCGTDAWTEAPKGRDSRRQHQEDISRVGRGKGVQRRRLAGGPRAARRVRRGPWLRRPAPPEERPQRACPPAVHTGHRRGVGVDSSGGRASGASARANLASPSLPRPYCAGVISAERILAESLGPAGRAARAEAGYAAVPEDGAASVASPPRRPPAPRRSFSAACFSGQPDRMRARQWPTRGTWRRGRCRPGCGPAAPARRGRARAAACQCRRRAREGGGAAGSPQPAAARRQPL